MAESQEIEGLVRALREGDDAAKTAAARTLCNRADLYFECQLRSRRGPMVDVRDFLDSLQLRPLFFADPRAAP